jgi:ParB family chromosome partitioning protein
MNKENKLGMGLGALLSTPSDNKESYGAQKINISEIQPNPSQPRKNFKENELAELATSIKNQGLIQPIIVRKINNSQYEIIAGERRWRASQLAGLHEVECVIKDLKETEILEAALIENIQ